MINDYIDRRIQDARAAALYAKTAVGGSNRIHIFITDINPSDVKGYAAANLLKLWEPSETNPYFWVHIDDPNALIVVESSKVERKVIFEPVVNN